MNMTLLEYTFLAAWVVGAFLLLNRKNIKLLRKLGRRFNGSLAFYSTIIPALDGIYDALKFNIHVTPKFAEVRGTLKIRLYARPLVELRVHRKSLISRAVGKAGILHLVKSGRLSFDEEFLVFARQAEIARAYLQRDSNLQAIRQLFDYGFSMLVIDAIGSWTEKQDYDRRLDLELSRVADVLTILKALSAGT